MKNLFNKEDNTVKVPTTATLSTSRKLSFSLVTGLGFVLLGELVLRLLGLPSGTFRMVEPGAVSSSCSWLRLRLVPSVAGGSYKHCTGVEVRPSN